MDIAPSQLQRDVSLRLPRSRWSLHFKEPFERQFRDSMFQQVKGLLRLNAAILLLTIVSLEVVAFIQVPEMARSPKSLIGVVGGVLFCSFSIVLSFAKQGGRHYERLIVPASVLNSLAMMLMASALPVKYIMTMFGGALLLIVAPMAYRIRLTWLIPMQLLIAAGWFVFFFVHDAYPTATGRPIAAGLFVLTALLISIVSSGVIEALSRREFSSNLALEIEQKKSDDLLRNVMPDGIANRLKAGEQVIADYCGAVSILFADLSGFTEMASEKSPRRLVELLNEIFARFDDLTGKFGLEKIKTMGDAYMAVAGLDDARKIDHAQAVVDCALDMLKALEVFNVANGATLRMKVGIHSGPVVAGVIGKKKFAYDIWGDSVNIASRMESHSLPNKIQISDATFKLVEHTHVCKLRGSQDIKGKGSMTTWFVEGRI